jgi:hypothetical protein
MDNHKDYFVLKDFRSADWRYMSMSTDQPARECSIFSVEIYLCESKVLQSKGNFVVFLLYLSYINNLNLSYINSGNRV